MIRPLSALLVLASSVSLAAPPQVKTVNPDSLPWSERASFFVGARGGIAAPPGAVGLAPNAGLEFGLAVPQGFGFSMRTLWMDNPPGAPVLGLRPASYGFGAIADFRYYFRTVDPLTVYPTLAVGFLAGPEKGTNTNAVLPLFNPGVGMKVKAGNFYGTFEFGLSGFTIPFVGLSLGFEGDSLVTKRERGVTPPAAEVQAEPAPTSQPDEPRFPAPPAIPAGS
ncbi:MAG: hypothetical protein JNJ54_36125 [Myxococcaceae bacterium]|nr:hypothetical protein [Myxococcaceae bacterium]